MTSLIILFILLSIGATVLMFWGKINFFQCLAMILIIGILIMLIPAIAQHPQIPKDKELISQTQNAKVYFSQSENKYYEITLNMGFEFWSLYNIKQIEAEK
jgi:hypothetical protein